ncbi:MAG: tRNA pseudouridine(38-40) synthase TruA [Oscillospiraceae bacterium]|nr:tRNA pseudouridine(38-40) synthase TruA [Oscillospiraceae bacterium]
MKRVLLKISYDGTNYHGWQVQPNAVTVQEVLQESLYKVLGNKPSVTGCSRTDAGVHANEFYCHLDCDDKIPETAFLKGLNSVLPNDIVVKECREVANDFHARYSAKGKEYVYNTFLEENQNPFYLRYALPLRRPIDLDRANAFCVSIVGTHDFLPFSSSGRTVTDTVRTVNYCEIRKNGDFTSLYISADGFLYNMVRIIVGTALEVSMGRLSPDCAEEIFKTGDRALAGPTVSPNALFLNKVFY